MAIFLNGEKYSVPGAVGVIEVRGNALADIPEFNVGVMIGQSPMGCSYSATDPDGNAYGADELFNLYSDRNALVRDYGAGELLIAYDQAKKTGNKGIFVMNPCKLTAAQCTLQDITPADTLKVKVRKYLWGAPGGKVSLAIVETASTQRVITAGAKTGTATGGSTTTLVDTAAGWTISALIGKWVRITAGAGIGQTRRITANTGTTLTVATWTAADTTSVYEVIEPLFTVTFTPPKDVSLLAANATAGNYFVNLKSNEGLAEGKSLQLTSNAGTTETVIVKSFETKWTSTGYKVILQGALANSFTTANYGLVFNKDATRTAAFKFIGVDWNLDNLVKTVNDANIFVALEAVSTTVPANVAETYIDVVSAATRGTSPAVATADYQTIAGTLKQWSREFLTANKINFRMFSLISSDSTAHGLLATAMVGLRANPESNPCQVVAGTALGDTLETGSADTNPGYRAYNLNTDEFQLCAIGFDDLPAYLSHAPQMFGIRMSNPVLHNPTRDPYVCSKVEKKLTYDSLKYYITHGVTVPIQTQNGYLCAFSVNTFQQQAVQWSPQDKKTYLTCQRDKADFVYKGIMSYTENYGIGIDGPRSAFTKALDAYITSNYYEDGYVTGYTIKEKPVPGGVVENIDILLPDQIDFAAIILGVQVALS